MLHYYFVSYLSSKVKVSGYFLITESLFYVCAVYIVLLYLHVKIIYLIFCYKWFVKHGR